MIASELWSASKLAHLQGRTEPAARLAAASLRLRERNGIGIEPFNAAEIEEEVAALRTELGADAFDAAWAAGESMEVAAAIEEAIAVTNEEVVEGRA